MFGPLRTGVALGAVVGFVHFLWATAVAIGVAKPIVEFILWMHFIRMPIEIAPFDLVVASALVATTSAAGFVLGYALAAVWNWLHPEYSPLVPPVPVSGRVAGHG